MLIQFHNCLRIEFPSFSWEDSICPMAFSNYWQLSARRTWGISAILGTIFSTFTSWNICSICILPSCTVLALQQFRLAKWLYCEHFTLFLQYLHQGPRMTWFFYRIVASKSAGRITGFHASISALFRFTYQKIYCIGQAGLRAGRFAGRASKPVRIATTANICYNPTAKYVIGQFNGSLFVHGSSHSPITLSTDPPTKCLDPSTLNSCIKNVASRL